MLLIKKIRLINPATNMDEIKDILVDDDVVIEISDDIDDEKADEDTLVIDGAGLVAAPGLVDVHIHFRDPGFTHKEDIITGANAALHGGVTTVVCMANTKPAVDNVDTLNYIKEKAKDTDINIYQAATVTKGMQGKEIVNFEELTQAGAVGFTDDGVPIMDEEILYKALEYSARTKMPISVHEEDPAFIGNAGVNDGEVAKAMGLKGASREAEISLTKRDIEIAKKTGGILSIQHISAKESVQLVRDAIGSGERNIHAEATPHHFSLTQDAVKEHGTLAKMNPPLRTQEDKMAIIEGLKDGTIDIIATDHAPHAFDEKNKEFTQAPSGIIGLETSFCLALTNLYAKGHLSLMQIIEKMSYNPAKMYGIDAGEIAIGKKADIVIFDPEEEWVFEEKDIYSKSHNTPFIGYTMKGKIKAVLCKGMLSVL